MTTIALASDSFSIAFQSGQNCQNACSIPILHAQITIFACSKRMLKRQIFACSKRFLRSQSKYCMLKNSGYCLLKSRSLCMLNHRTKLLNWNTACSTPVQNSQRRAFACSTPGQNLHAQHLNKILNRAHLHAQQLDKILSANYFLLNGARRLLHALAIVTVALAMV